MEESEKKSLVAEIAQLVVNTLKPFCQSRSQKAAEHERLIDPGFRLILLSNTPGKVKNPGSLGDPAYVAEDGASAILRHHLDVFVNYDDGQMEFDETPEEVSQENTRLKKLLNLSVNEIELSVRAANCLNNANITTVGQLAIKTEADMLKYRNFGKKSLNEIKDKLLQLGLSLGMKFESGLVEPPMGSERSEDGKLVSF